jgi:hypothetical protein
MFYFRFKKHKNKPNYMRHDLAVLNILHVNKTVVFYSPLEGKDVLVKTGTISEGSLFFSRYSLYAYSNNYVSMNIEGRMKFVKRLRESISQKVDKLTWENLFWLVAKIQFQENVNTILSNFYKHIINEKTYKSKWFVAVVKKVIIDKNKI